MNVCRPLVVVFVVSLLCVPLIALPAAQDNSAIPTDETVANLAAGRIVIAVVKNAILVATLENPIEADTLPPTPVPLATSRLGVLLGPVFWWSPNSKLQLASLDQELPRLHSRLIANVPHLSAEQHGEEATDIETIGQGLLERLNDVAQNLHGKIDLPASEPLLQLIVADYLPGYGPEVWQLNYAMKQQEEQDSYWTTRVLRPGYLQFWPPEKGQPHTPVEFAYPPENPSESLFDLVRQKDPRLEKVIASDQKMTQVANQFLQGESNKILPAEATQFLRTALDAIAPPKARETMAIITEEKGCEWILAPPPEPKAMPKQEPSQRSADAPSLLKPPQ